MSRHRSMLPPKHLYGSDPIAQSQMRHDYANHPKPWAFCDDADCKKWVAEAEQRAASKQS